MPGQWKEVVTLRFKGKRFRDHALDLSAVTELRQFQKMVAATAKALWRAAHPDRERLPPHFEERTRLCLRRIEEGSAAVPLEVYQDLPEQMELWEPEPEELRKAISLAYDVFDAAATERELPSTLPRDLVSEYEEFGKTLTDDEEIELQPSEQRSAVRINSESRQRLRVYVEAPHSSMIDITGECLEADVRQRRFQVWVDAHNAVQATFDEAQEELVTSALKQHRSVRIRVQGTAEVSSQGKPLRFLGVERLELVRPNEPAFDQSAPPIEEQLAAIWTDVPTAEWSKLPADLTDNLDHYLYGAPE